MPKAVLPVGEELPWQDRLAAVVYASEAREKILSDVVITLSGYIPEGANVVAYLVAPEDLPVTLEEVNVLCAYDITIYTSNGVEFEPEGDDLIIVNIETPELESVDEASVYHVKDETESEPAPEPELVAEVVSVPDGKVEFEANEFSIYAIVNNTKYSTSYNMAVNETLKLINYGNYLVDIQISGNWSIYSGSDVVQFTTGNYDTSSVTIKGISAGTAVIHCNYYYQTNTFTITVTEPGVTVDVTPATSTINMSGTVQLSAAVSADSADVTPNSTITWSSDNNDIAKVSESGRVTAVAAGTATITAEATYYDSVTHTTHTGSGSAAVTVSTELTPIDTVDSTSLGVTMKMWNFDNPTNSNGMKTAIGSGGNYTVNDISGTTKEGLVKPQLNEDGYPVTTHNSTSLGTWFNFDTGTAANHLFTYSGDYLYYNSADNFAHFDSSTGDFTVYNQLGTTSDAIGAEHYFYQRGNFMPYNTLDVNNPRNKNYYDYLGNELNSGDPRYGENLYGFNEYNDYYFGMYMTFDFIQPEGGQVDGAPMVFEFTGDDDMWVFIDGVLVLDLGGIHDAQSGSINFATGEVRWTDTELNADEPDWCETTIADMLTAAGVSTQELSGNTYADYSTHTLTMFYMERGAGASNLRIRFNLPPIPTSSVTVNKTFGIDGKPTTTAPNGFDATFYLYDSDDYAEDFSGATVIDSASYSDFTDGSYTFSNLTPGTYTVVEVLGDAPSDYDHIGTTANGADGMSADATVTYSSGGSVTFKNSYESESTPDNTYIIVQKTFTGIENSQINNDFSITVTDGTTNYILDSFNTTNVSGGGLIWTWKVAVPAGTYTVSESNAEVDGYTLTVTGDIGTSVTTQETNMTFTAPDMITKCNLNDYNIGAVNLICAQLTTGGKYFVWSAETLSANRRAAVVALMKEQNAGFNQATVDNTYFYSGDNISQSSGLYFRDSYIQYDGTTTLHFSNPSQWAKFFTANYNFEESPTPEISVTNAYFPTAGYRLPETGGPGTNPFTRVGTFLIFLSFAGTALLFPVRGRRKRSGVKAPDRRGRGGFLTDG